MTKSESAWAHGCLLAFATFAVLACVWMFAVGWRIESHDYRPLFVINNLRNLEVAKEVLALEHHTKAGEEIGWPDLAANLKGGTISPVAGESYTLNPIGRKPTARTSIKLGTCAAGSVIAAP